MTRPERRMTRPEAVAHILEIAAISRMPDPSPYDEEDTVEALRVLGVTTAELTLARMPWAGS